MGAESVDTYSPEQAVEDGFAQLVTDLGNADVKVTKAWDDWDALKGKVVSVMCRASEPEVLGSGFTGNFIMTVEIAMRSHKGDVTGAQHAALEAAVRPTFLVVDLPGLLNPRSPKAIIMRAVPRSFQRTAAGDWRVSTQAVECYVAPQP